jgi:hypothetical protein
MNFPYICDTQSGAGGAWLYNQVRFGVPEPRKEK